MRSDVTGLAAKQGTTAALLVAFVITSNNTSDSLRASFPKEMEEHELRGVDRITAE